jgi:hypothetical protein
LAVFVLTFADPTAAVLTLVEEPVTSLVSWTLLRLTFNLAFLQKGKRGVVKELRALPRLVVIT